MKKETGGRREDDVGDVDVGESQVAQGINVVLLDRRRVPSDLAREVVDSTVLLVETVTTRVFRDGDHRELISTLVPQILRVRGGAVRGVQRPGSAEGGDLETAAIHPLTHGLVQETPRRRFLRTSREGPSEVRKKTPGPLLLLIELRQRAGSRLLGDGVDEHAPILWLPTMPRHSPHPASSSLSASTRTAWGPSGSTESLPWVFSPRKCLAELVANRSPRRFAADLLPSPAGSASLACIGAKSGLTGCTKVRRARSRPAG